MAGKMRLMRLGKKNHPIYRICVMEAGSPRDGACIENVGSYDPFLEAEQKRVRINKERAEYWLSVGAQPSETVLSFLKRAKVSGLIRQKPKRKRRRTATKTSLAAGTGAHAASPGEGGTKSRKPPKKREAQKEE